ncbi:unnamed protein product [Phaedon cochleariae]|uniref:Uncharacterized protein n=1 Tax=Phaedon cochleariae TaxID=80249 RepID=A0A9N9SJ37_PHACE|nr:unnamed protein product [Phaedon cochleariae]
MFIYALIICLTTSLSTCQNYENQFCTYNSSHSLNQFSTPNYTDIICMNMILNDTMKLKLENQSKPLHIRSSIQLINITGNITTKTLVLFPFVNNVLIYRCRIDNIDADFKSLVHLHIAESIIPNISKEMFQENRYYLLSFGLHSNVGLKFGESPFELLDYLDDLIIYNQSLSSINDCFFNGLNHLKYLVLNKNDIKYLHENAFIGLNELREINMDNNPLEYFTTNIRHMHKLEKLSLLHTNIREFHVTQFFPLIKMRVLKIPFPAARDIEVSGLAIGFPNLRNIVVDSHDIDEDSDMFKLRNLRLAGLNVDRISKLPTEVSIFAGRLKYEFPSLESDVSKKFPFC